LATTNITEENFQLQCVANYKKCYCSTTEDFLADLKRIKYIKKLLTRFKTTGKLDERLILNHIIVLNNVFGPTFLCRILYFKLANYFVYIKPFLLYLNLLPFVIYQVNHQNIDTVSIEIDPVITMKLKNLT